MICDPTSRSCTVYCGPAPTNVPPRPPPVRERVGLSVPHTRLRRQDVTRPEPIVACPTDDPRTTHVRRSPAAAAPVTVTRGEDDRQEQHEPRPESPSHSASRTPHTATRSRLILAVNFRFRVRPFAVTENEPAMRPSFAPAGIAHRQPAALWYQPCHTSFLPASAHVTLPAVICLPCRSGSRTSRPRTDHHAEPPSAQSPRQAASASRPLRSAGSPSARSAAAPSPGGV